MNHAAEWFDHWAGTIDISRFAAITADEVADALRKACIDVVQNGARVHALENRVFRFRGRGGLPDLYAKIYRPGSWDAAAIDEELDFIRELRVNGLPVAQPSVLLSLGDLHLCAFEGATGRDLTNCGLRTNQIETLGRMASQLHAIGRQRKTTHRRSMHPADYAAGGSAWLPQCGLVPASAATRLADLTSELLIELEVYDFGPCGRIHGDLGLWNMRWSDNGLMVYDFDDMGEGPCVHDLAQIALGIGGFTSPPTDASRRNEIVAILGRAYGIGAKRLGAGIALILAARRVHVSAWIASRWNDPRFRAKYPDFPNESRWRRELEWIQAELKESKEGM